MARIVRASVVSLYHACRDQLVARRVITADRIIPSTIDNPPHVNTDSDIVLRMRELKMDTGPSDSMGRIELRLRRRLTLIVRTLLALDEPDRDWVWLTDQTLGHWIREEAAVDALHQFCPRDEDGNQLVFEPMRLLPSTEATRDYQDRNWGWSAMDFDVPIIFPCDQTIQPFG